MGLVFRMVTWLNYQVLTCSIFVGKNIDGAGPLIPTRTAIILNALMSRLDSFH